MIIGSLYNVYINLEFEVLFLSTTSLSEVTIFSIYIMTTWKWRDIEKIVEALTWYVEAST